MNLDEYQNANLPNDWEITGLFGDVILVEFSDGDGDNVDRGGILIPVDVSKALWRVGKVLLKGPQASDHVKVGDSVIFPNDKGIRAISKDKTTKYVFINEERLFGIVSKIKQ